MAESVESGSVVTRAASAGIDLSWLRSGPGLALLAAGLVLLLLAGPCLRSPAVPVRVAPVQATALTIEVNTNGKVEPIEKAEVHARLDGLVLAIPDPGTHVQKGEVLLLIDGGPVSGELKAAESERLAALETLRQAEAELARVRRRAATDADLFAKGAVTRERNAESQTERRAAREHVAFLTQDVPLRVEALDLKIQELRARRAAAVFEAPFSGTVYRTAVERGQTVSVGDPVLWFADLERLRVRANVDQVDLGRVKPGQQVWISSNAYPGRRWKAEISEVIPHVVARESRFVSEALAKVGPASDGLVPGMTVDVEIVVESVDEALQVPAEAVFSDDDGRFVYRIDGHHAHRTSVKTGRTTISTIEVLEGLEPGWRVALGPAEGLVDGSRVEERNRDDG